MAKAVITILGTISKPRDGQEKAKYYFSDELKDKFSLENERYTNMLPLLIKNFKSEYKNIKCIYSTLSKEKQTEVLEYEDIKFDIKDNGLFISENIKDDEADYSYFLSKYNDLIEEYEEVIIDVSHGFRHLPILAIINLIIQNIKNPEKIEHILFAKEIKQYEEYEIIDIKEYLDLAKLSFVLSSFNFNYTVGNEMSFENREYNELTKKLTEISTHILGNSLKQLIGKDSLTDKTIETINKLLEEDSKLATFKIYLDSIVEHLTKIKELDKEMEYIQYYKLSEMMGKRGYLLNSITLLNEAIGFYCVEELKKIDTIEEHIKSYHEKIESANNDEDKKKFNLYKLTHHSKTIIKQQKDFKGAYLFNEKSEHEKSEVKAKILIFLKNRNYTELSTLIEKIENLRNNLAHGNSSEGIKNVKENISNLLAKFKKKNLKPIIKKIEVVKKPKKEKIIPTGIDAPKEKVTELEDIFNNR